eukprot:Rhum_TRINITY_DN15378_c16_g1::Rhum_TRINITY_DN15378_c16_g1_i1::g.154400::m.154400
MMEIGIIAGVICLFAGLISFFVLRRNSMEEARGLASYDVDEESEVEYEDEIVEVPMTLETTERDPALEPFLASPLHTVPLASSLIVRNSANLQHQPGTNSSHLPGRKKKAKTLTSRRSLKDRRSPPALEAFDSLRSIQTPRAHASYTPSPLSPRSRRRTEHHGGRSSSEEHQELQELVRLSSELREKRQSFSNKLGEHVRCVADALNTAQPQAASGQQPPADPRMAASLSMVSLAESGGGLSEQVMYSPRTHHPDEHATEQHLSPTSAIHHHPSHHHHHPHAHAGIRASPVQQHPSQFDNYVQSTPLGVQTPSGLSHTYGTTTTTAETPVATPVHSLHPPSTAFSSSRRSPGIGSEYVMSSM